MNLRKRRRYIRESENCEWSTWDQEGEKDTFDNQNFEAKIMLELQPDRANSSYGSNGTNGDYVDYYNGGKFF